jgi:hypothetical protein
VSRSRALRRFLGLAVRRMAESGEGTSECLKHGCLPMLVHYYSPVPDIDDLRAREMWDRRTPMAGIEMREGELLPRRNLESNSAPDAGGRIDVPAALPIPIWRTRASVLAARRRRIALSEDSGPSGSAKSAPGFRRV